MTQAPTLAEIRESIADCSLIVEGVRDGLSFPLHLLPDLRRRALARQAEALEQLTRLRDAEAFLLRLDSPSATVWI